MHLIEENKNKKIENWKSKIKNVNPSYEEKQGAYLPNKESTFVQSVSIKY